MSGRKDWHVIIIGGGIAGASLAYFLTERGVPIFCCSRGQGGCGIETSPAVGRIAAALLVDGRTNQFDVSVMSPARFAPV